MRTLVLYSGGLDSTTVLAMELAAGHEVLALSIDYAQSNRAELDKCRRLAALWGFPHKVVSVNVEKTDARAEIPARNTMFIAKALEQALLNGCDTIAYGAEPDATYTDSSRGYIAAAQQLCRLHGVNLVAPIKEMAGKRAVLEKALDLGVPLDLVHSSRTNEMNGADAASGRFLKTLHAVFPWINPVGLLQVLAQAHSNTDRNPYELWTVETGSFKFFPALFLLAGEWLEELEPCKELTVYTTGNWGKSVQRVNTSYCRRFEEVKVVDVETCYGKLRENRCNTDHPLAVWGTKQALSRLPRPAYLKSPLSCQVIQGHLRNTLQQLGYVFDPKGIPLITARWPSAS